MTLRVTLFSGVINGEYKSLNKEITEIYKHIKNEATSKIVQRLQLSAPYLYGTIIEILVMT
jgi:hypothetical protein